MEGQAERLVSLVTALVVEEVVIEVVAHTEESAAFGVHHSVSTIGAESTLLGFNNCSWIENQRGVYVKVSDSADLALREIEQ